MAAMLVFLGTACAGEGEKNGITLTTIYENSEKMILEPGDTEQVELNVPLGEDNYLRLSYVSDICLEGVFRYETEEGKREEDFFLREDEDCFSQILDWYGEYSGEKTLISISLTNVSGERGEIGISRMEKGKKEIYYDKMAYLENDSLKVGIVLGWGGGIGFLTRNDQRVEQVKVDDEMQIGVNYSRLPGAVLEFDEDVNLINSSSAGRAAQVSLYGIPGDRDRNIYDGKIYRTTQTVWPYNPVQCGDQYNNHSQIVDYEIGENEIIVKTRALDWAQNFLPSKSYMTCTYRLDGEVVEAENRYYDWTGIPHQNRRNQEVPAFSGVVPFDTFVTYHGKKPFEGEPLQYYDKLGYWSVAAGANPDDYFSRSDVTENWSAWINDDDWGIGLYVPDVKKTVAGRHRDFTLNFEGAATDQVQFNYTAFLSVFSLASYEELCYRFYLSAGDVTQMRELFNDMAKSGKYRNENLLAWEAK